MKKHTSVLIELAVVAVVCGHFPGVTHADEASGQLELPAEPLSDSLWAVGKRWSINILFSPTQVAGVRAPALSGADSIEKALDILLAGTNLRYRFIDEHTVSLMMGTVGFASPEKSLRLAAASREASSSLPPSEGDESVDNKEILEEVIVTAQKKSERLQDVPVPVTSISAQTLIDNSQLRLQDYYSTVPGFAVTGQGNFQTLSIRGITTGTISNPTVGVTIDDVPYGPSTSIGTGGDGQVVPDIDPADLTRVEVLRGPQGTLYGASSMGGLIKFVTAEPSTAGLSGRVETDISSVYNGAELGYGARGEINVPLSDTLATRASGFIRQDPGYIDNVETGQRGVNEAKADGGRLSALWSPAHDFSLKLSALYQDIRGDGSSDVDKPINGYVGPVLQDWQQYHIPDTGAYDRSVQAYNATLIANLGSAELTAISGYNEQAFSDSFDFSNILGPLTQLLFGVTGTPAHETNRTSKFTQEIRLSATIGQSFEWLLGAFYTYEDSKYYEFLSAENPTTRVVLGTPWTGSFPSTYTEYAGFADLTVHLTDTFDIQVGGRESRISQTASTVYTGAFVPYIYLEPSPFIQPQSDSKANAFTYLFTPRLKLSPDVMVYARLASGYRPGGTNYYAGPGTPLQFNPDKTQNYEIGAKGDLLDHMLSVDASLYYIDWKNIQLQLANPQTGFGYQGNGSEAKSQGVELSVESRPLTGLTIAAWVAWDDAVLTQTFPSTSTAYGVAGDRLPYSSRFSGNLSLEQRFSLARGVTGFIGGAVSYVGDRQGEFTTTAVQQRQDLPGYTKTDLRLGGQYDSWSANLFVNNVTDRRGVLSGGFGTLPVFGFVYIQPRTVGLSVVRNF